MPCRLILLRCSQNIYEKNSGRPDTTKFRTKLEIFWTKRKQVHIKSRKVSNNSKIGFEIIINIRALDTITVMKFISCCQIVLLCNIYTHLF